MVPVKFDNALGIDVGERRIGLARVNSVAKLPEPLGTYLNDDSFPSHLIKVIEDHSIDVIVVGLPRNMRGKETPQTSKVREYVKEVLNKHTNLPIYFQDETLSSVAAAEYSKEDVARFGLDSLAAVVILNDFIKGNQA